MTKEQLIEQFQKLLERYQAMSNSGAYENAHIIAVFLRTLMALHDIEGSFEAFIKVLPSDEEIQKEKERQLDEMIIRSRRRAMEDGWNG